LAIETWKERNLSFCYIELKRSAGAKRGLHPSRTKGSQRQAGRPRAWEKMAGKRNHTPRLFADNSPLQAVMLCPDPLGDAI
jgi:hypothetical protein